MGTLREFRLMLSLLGERRKNNATISIWKIFSMAFSYFLIPYAPTTAASKKKVS
jgi:hypothetical protein